MTDFSTLKENREAVRTATAEAIKKTQQERAKHQINRTGTDKNKSNS